MRSRTVFRHFQPYFAKRDLAQQVKPEKYFFVDTNVILGYRLDQYQDIKGFITDPAHKFFYTETVLDELQHKNGQFPEADPDCNKETLFTFVKSGLSDKHKRSSIEFLERLWLAEFPDQGKKSARFGFKLDARQMLRFQKDLYVLFESSYACHAPNVVPIDEFIMPQLLTNNMRLLKKFLLRDRTEAVLENVINLCGMEHLITANYLEDEIEAWTAKREMTDQNSNDVFGTKKMQ